MTAAVRHVARRKAGTVTVVVIGAGHSGLAMSRCLTERSIDHVVLERGEIANAWRHERWDSLRLLTPNWLTRLPGLAYDGADPDGYMTMSQVAAFIDRYARLVAAPVQTGTTVQGVRPAADGYQVETNRGRWRCRAVVIASGGFSLPIVPRVAEAVPHTIAQLTPLAYRNAAQLETGGVLVVGASATGVQIADEISRAGHPVTLAVGEHVRMPRVYRGLDIQWWMHAAGVLDQRYDAIVDIERARRVPSPQLAGTAERRTLDLNSLREQGVGIVGRLVGWRDGRAQFSGALRNLCALADLKLGRLLDTIDAWAGASGIAAEVGPPERYAPTRVDDRPRLGPDLARAGISTVVWATGFRPDYAWLQVPVLDRAGRIRHDGGVVDAPGLYVLGLPFMRRRKSSFIHGAADDARELCGHLAGYLAGRRATVRPTPGESGMSRRVA